MNKRSVLLASILLGAVWAPVALAQPVAAAQPAPDLNAVTIRDVPAGHWARAAIEMLVRRKVLTGYPDGTFGGSRSISRFEAAVVFTRLLSSGGAAALAPMDSAVLSRGLDEVRADLGRARAQLDLLEAHVGQQAGALGDLSAGQLAQASLRSGQSASLMQLQADAAALKASSDAQAVTLASLALARPAPVPAAAAGPAPAAPAGGGDPSTLPDVAFKPAQAPVGLAGAASAGGPGVLAGYATPGSLFFGVSYDFAGSPLGVQLYGGPSEFGLNATARLGQLTSDVAPYLLAGGGYNLDRHSVYGRAGVGLGYALTSTLGLFGEGYANYTFGAGLGFGARAGIKLSF